jgi:hypothetical protein
MGHELDMLFAVNASPDLQVWKLGFAELTWAERVFRTVWGLVGEVDNGGFDQFYFNSSGDTAFFVPEALQAIGAIETAKVVSAANAIFPGPHPAANREQRIRELDALDESSQRQLKSLEDLFYRTPDDLNHLLFSFVRSHKAEIRGAESCG